MGTWAAAWWAVRFYEKHGFRLVTPEEKDRLLRTYWTISPRQVETSVVLADPKWLRRGLADDWPKDYRCWLGNLLQPVPNPLSTTPPLRSSRGGP